jgi:prophage regulatory protein
MQQDTLKAGSLLRLPQVLELIPVSRSAWWAGVKSGKYPKSVKLGERTTCWRSSDIMALIEQAGG